LALAADRVFNIQPGTRVVELAPTGVRVASRTWFGLLDVLTDASFAGNQLAVFPDAQVDDDAMQRTARELNLSESVFLSRGGAIIAASVRIFTPQREVEFAGHPTIGKFARSRVRPSSTTAALMLRALRLNNLRCVRDRAQAALTRSPRP
jgi:predicted PhzF superfamily epimerase YddE/YHI9